MRHSLPQLRWAYWANGRSLAVSGPSPNAGSPRLPTHTAPGRYWAGLVARRRAPELIYGFEVAHRELEPGAVLIGAILVAERGLENSRFLACAPSLYRDRDEGEQ